MSDVAVAEVGLFDRAWKRVSLLWRDMAATVGSPAADASWEGRMRACLEARGGEVSARARAAGLAQSYQTAPEAVDKLAFFQALASFDSDFKVVEAAMAAVSGAKDAASRAAAKAKLRQALEPPRLKLLTQFTTIPDGMKFLVDMRADLMRLMGQDPMLHALERDMRGLLANWFDLGFLELRRIDWSSPAALLEKLVGYEAVHKIRTWRDLKNRLDSDRRCYAFFHPRMPEEPLIFVEVALVQGLSGSVQKLLDEKAPVLDPRMADTAIFYSINNCQRGLDGISFGNSLIKRVVTLLAEEMRGLKTFSTLSPIPGFRRWLEEQKDAPDLLTEEESKSLAEAAGTPDGNAAIGLVLAARRPLSLPWIGKAEPVLTRLCARYLVLETGKDGRRARDPVGHFHLSNGARIERVNWRGDTSEKGLKESLGFMVNYLYDPMKIEDYHEAYVGEGSRAAPTSLRRLARGGR
ncbi:malonyl-CoA decarboxylase [Pseudoroseomonas ludipueritiae]|uniref:Malonyl-CoA decarboxylase n=1 Tax=Pseudoroseomonas ludipueritiae TaxID=198093 RepID=A0ABR7RCF7_9PROT|nr:malonyl-CoA decarboxylase [Pseudoroseomonas ludipueritiae]MBC9179431.1 malonyl-CoA decarboxylase [Pseudoroseomonas ludipueritiae]